MTTTIGSLAVSLSMDASNFNGSINQMNRHLTSMGSELRAVRALGTDYGRSVEGLASKKEILTRAVATSSVKLTEERRKYDELVASGTANEATLERQARRVNEAQTQYNRLTTELNEVTEELLIQSSAWTQVGQSLEAVGGKMKAIGDGMVDVGKKMSMAITAPIVAAGTASVKMAADFEAQMDRVGAIAGATSEDMDKLTESALDLGAQTSKSASEVAIGMENMAAMGFTTNEILGAMPGIISAAEASGADMAQTADVVAAALNSFGLEAKEASRVADVLAQSANQSAADITDLQYAFKYAAPIANSLGISMEELAASVGIMSDAGIKGEQAGTTLRGGLIALLKPAEKTSKMMDAMGITVEDAEGKFVGLSGLIENISDALEGQTDVQKMANLATLVGTEAASGFLTLMEAGPQKIDEMTKSLENSAGASSETAAKMKDNLKGALEELGGSIETAAITIGNKLIPSIRKGAEKVQELVEKFSNLSPEAQKNILVMAGVAAAIGPVLVVSGTLISSIGTIITAAGTMSTAIGAAGGAFAVLTGPIGLTVAGLTAVTIGAVALYRHLDQKGLPQIDLFGDKVSESTQKAVIGFVELNDKATIELNKLSWGSMVVTQDMANSITETFNQMGDQVLAGMQEDHEAQLAQLNTFFSTSNAISEEQEKNVLAQLDKMNEEQATKYQDNTNRINEILRIASEEKRKTTVAENAELARLQEEQMTTGIKILSDGEVEFLTIMERMKSQSAEITAEQAIQTISDARTTKNDVVAEAEKQYEEAVSAFIRLRDESGAITAEQAAVLIEDATRQRDEVIKKADDMYSGVLEIAKEKGGEHLTENEIMLGKQLSLWDEWSIDITIAAAKTYAKTSSSFKSMAIESAISFAELRQKGTEAFIGMNKTIDFVMNDLPGIIKRKMALALAEVILKVAEFKQVGRDIVQGLINGMTEKIDDVTSKARSIGNAIITATKNTLKVKSPSRIMIGIGRNVSEGLAMGIKEKENEVIAKAAQVSRSLITSAKNILSKGTKETVSVISSINKKANEEAKKIETRTNQDIYQIKANAKAKKRSLTSTELLKIQRLEQDSATKVKKINEKAASDVAKINEKSGKERLDALKSFVEEKKQLDQLSLVDEVKVWEASVSSFKNGTKEKAEAQKAYQKALNAVNDEITSINKEYSNQMKTINDDLKKSEEDLTKAYEDAYSKRANSLISFRGIFDDFTIEIKSSGVDLLNNLKSQVDGFKTWQDEFGKLANTNIDINLLDELREMGPNALPELIALNSLTEEQLSQYSALYQEKSAIARQQAAVELIGMKEDTEIQIEELRQAANSKLSEVERDWTEAIRGVTKATSDELKSLKQIGINAGQGLLNGLASMEPALIAKANAIANSIRSAIQSALDIHSPSRVMRALGVNIGEGLVLGMEDSMKAVAYASQMLANSTVQPYQGISGSTSVQTDNSRHFRPTINIHTNDSGDKAMERTLRRMAYQFN